MKCSLPSLMAGVWQWSVHTGQTSQQSSGNDGNSSDWLDIQANGRTDGRPAEIEHCWVRLLTANDTTSDPYHLTQIQSLSPAQHLLQWLTQRSGVGDVKNWLPWQWKTATQDDITTVIGWHQSCRRITHPETVMKLHLWLDNSFRCVVLCGEQTWNQNITRQQSRWNPVWRSRLVPTRIKPVQSHSDALLICTTHTYTQWGQYECGLTWNYPTRIEICDLHPLTLIQGRSIGGGACYSDGCDAEPDAELSPKEPIEASCTNKAAKNPWRGNVELTFYFNSISIPAHFKHTTLIFINIFDNIPDWNHNF